MVVPAREASLTPCMERLARREGSRSGEGGIGLAKAFGGFQMINSPLASSPRRRGPILRVRKGGGYGFPPARERHQADAHHHSPHTCRATSRTRRSFATASS